MGLKFRGEAKSFDLHSVAQQCKRMSKVLDNVFELVNSPVNGTGNGVRSGALTSKKKGKEKCHIEEDRQKTFEDSNDVMRSTDFMMGARASMCTVVTAVPEMVHEEMEPAVETVDQPDSIGRISKASQFSYGMDLISESSYPSEVLLSTDLPSAGKRPETDSTGVASEVCGVASPKQRPA